MATESERIYNERIRRENPPSTPGERANRRMMRRQEKNAERAKRAAIQLGRDELRAQIEQLVGKLIPYFDKEEWLRVSRTQVTRKPSVEVRYGMAEPDVLYICVNHEVYTSTGTFAIKLSMAPRSYSSLCLARDKLRAVLGAYQSGREDPLSAQ